MNAGMRKGIHKSRGGLIRSFVTVENGRIKDIAISGDFFLFPEDAFFKMVERLKGIKAERGAIQKTIEEAYSDESIASPGTLPSDFAESIMNALEE